MRKTFTYIAAVLLGAWAAAAADSDNGWFQSHLNSNDSPRFTAHELDLGLFGSYINREGKFDKIFQTNIRHGRWGGGGELDYFITREIGLGADVNLSEHPGRIVDQVTGNLIVRLPIGDTIAPYIVATGGRAMSPLFRPEWDWVYGGGVGLEWRFCRTLGVFSDARFFWSDSSTSNDRMLLRAGLRVAF